MIVFIDCLASEVSSSPSSRYFSISFLLRIRPQLDNLCVASSPPPPRFHSHRQRQVAMTLLTRTSFSIRVTLKRRSKMPRQSEKAKVVEGTASDLLHAKATFARRPQTCPSASLRFIDLLRNQLAVHRSERP